MYCVSINVCIMHLSMSISFYSYECVFVCMLCREGKKGRKEEGEERGGGGGGGGGGKEGRRERNV